MRAGGVTVNIEGQVVTGSGFFLCGASGQQTAPRAEVQASIISHSTLKAQVNHHALPQARPDGAQVRKVKAHTTIKQIAGNDDKVLSYMGNSIAYIAEGLAAEKCQPDFYFGLGTYFLQYRLKRIVSNCQPDRSHPGGVNDLPKYWENPKNDTRIFVSGSEHIFCNIV